MTSWKSSAALFVALTLILMLPLSTPAVPAPVKPRLMVQEGHAGRVDDATFSPDGKLALTASIDNTVRLWDVATGKQVLRLAGNKAVFSPDGACVLSAGPDLKARLLETSTGALKHLLQGHLGPILSLAFSRDGNLALTSGADRTTRLWDVKTGKPIHVLTSGEVKKGQPNPAVRSADISPDGQLVLTGSDDNTARLWKTANGELVHLLQGHTRGVNHVAFSGDGRLALTGSHDTTARLWDVKTGKQVQLFEGQRNSVSGLAFSPDNKLVLISCWGGPAQLWDLQTGKPQPFRAAHNRSANSGGARAVAFSPDGRLALTAGFDGATALIDVKTARLVHLLQGHSSFVSSAVFSPDGKLVLTGSDDSTVRLWNVQTGKPLHPGMGFSAPVLDAVWDAHGSLVLGGSFDRTVWLWDVLGGKQVRLLTGHTGVGQDFGSIQSLALRSDGKVALTGGDDQTVRLWDVPTGKQTFVLRGHSNTVEQVSFSPDGKLALSRGYPGSMDAVACLWDLQTGKHLHTLQSEHGVQSQSFSADSKRVLLGYTDGTVRVWDVQTGKATLVLKGHKGFSVDSTAFSSDGKRLLTSGGGGARLWDAQTGKLIQYFEGQLVPKGGKPFTPDGKGFVTEGGVWDTQTGKKIVSFSTAMSDAWIQTPIAFRADGKRLLTGNEDNTVHLWDVVTGKELRVFQGHTAAVSLVAFSPDGKQALSVSEDKSTRFWDLETGQELCRLSAFTDGSWTVVDPEHRYDASNGGDVAGLHWVVGLEPIALNQLKERYYEPGLLAKKLGINKDPLRPVQQFAAPKLYPNVEVSQPTPDNPKLAITLTSREGGIGRVVVKLNGKEISSDARPEKADPKDGKLKIDLDLRNDPRLKPGARNVIEVEAYNAEGYLRSRSMEKLFVAEGQEEKDPKLWAIVVGVSKYSSPSLELRYAARDAEAFAAALRIGAARLFGADKVSATVLTTARQATELQPTRANLIQALESAQKARPGDVIVIYLAGHGVNHGGADGDFYYLTREASGADLTDPEVRRQTALSSADLTELLKKVPAQKQVLILDTCASGKAIARLTEKRDVPGSQVRALERVKDRTGLHVLAGCAADSVSYEASRYGQGVLTYSLLLGMRGAKLRDGEYVDVLDLFNFAADKVPELARNVGGVQRPVIASPRGSSFDIGRLAPEDREKIPFQKERPLVLRATVQEEARARDGLGLGKLVNEGLRSASAAGRGAALVYVDATEFPGAVEVGGRYKVAGNKVTVTVSLFVGNKDLAAFQIEGDKDKVDDLAGRLVAEIEKRLVGQ